MFPSQYKQNENLSYRHTLAHLFATGTSSLRRLNFASWLRMALVFTIVTGGLLVAFFGITVRVQAATAPRFTPAAPPPLGCAHERSCPVLSQQETCGRALRRRQQGQTAGLGQPALQRLRRSLHVQLRLAPA